MLQSSNGSSKIETYWIKTSRYLFQCYPCNSTIVQRGRKLLVFQQRSFQWNPETTCTCLPVSDGVPIAKMFSALSPEHFMTDSKHSMQFKDTDGFVTWGCNSHGYGVCCQWKHEVEIIFNPLVHHHLSLIFMLGHPRHSSHSSSNEREPRNCNKGIHTHKHRQIDVEPTQFVISCNHEPPINSSVKNPK
jgi:hypothetical protein